MTREHAPGPWKLTPRHKIESWWIEDADGKNIADLEANEPTYYGKQHSDANAYLIAAAPDLLAACENALRSQPFGILPEWCHPIVEAIAKATGETHD